jgi:hypothetical protein
MAISRHFTMGPWVDIEGRDVRKYIKLKIYGVRYLKITSSIYVACC